MVPGPGQLSDGDFISSVFLGGEGSIFSHVYRSWFLPERLLPALLSPTWAVCPCAVDIFFQRVPRAPLFSVAGTSASSWLLTLDSIYSVDFQTEGFNPKVVKRILFFPPLLGSVLCLEAFCVPGL